MGASRRYPPNRRLTWERLQRGWSHEEVVYQVKRSMETCGEKEPGLIANTVRRWESGERWPEPRFRKHLVLIYGKPASELGLLTSDELAVQPPDDEALELVRKLLTTVTKNADHQGFGRLTFLRGLLGAGLVPLINPLGASAETIDALAHGVSQAADPDIRSIEAYTTITTQQRQLYWSTSARALFESALSHTQVGIQLLGNAVRDNMRKRLARSLAEAALLSARLAFFDLRQPKLAERCFDVARDAAEEADDQALATAIFGHMSFMPAFAEAPDQQSALAYLDAAHSHARYAGGPALRSWLHCVAAEVTARTGAPDRSLRHVRQAQDSLATGGTDPVWLDFYDASRLAGFTGQAQLLAGRYADAAVSLEDALAGLDPKATKQRAVVLFDLAAAHAAEDAERAAHDVNQAFDTLEQGWYATAHERVPQVRAALAGTPYASTLEDRVKAINSGGMS
jgi:tetratricopeptide (TPR) repeat protein